MKIIHFFTEGRNYTPERYCRDLRKVQQMVEDGPLFEYALDCGVLFATDVPSVGDAVEDWDTGVRMKFKVRPLQEAQEAAEIDAWFHEVELIEDPNDWTRHNTFTDLLLTTMESMHF